MKAPLRRLRADYRVLTAPLRGMPSVLLIGAQRSGSTSLFNYLAQHPDVRVPLGKEIHYFDLHYARGLTWYQGRFPYRHRHPTDPPLLPDQRADDHQYGVGALEQRP